MKTFFKPNKFKVTITIIFGVLLFLPFENLVVFLVLNLPLYLLTMNQVGYDAPQGANVLIAIPSILLYWYFLSCLMFDLVSKYLLKRNVK